MRIQEWPDRRVSQILDASVLEYGVGTNGQADERGTEEGEEYLHRSDDREGSVHVSKCQRESYYIALQMSSSIL